MSTNNSVQETALPVRVSMPELVGTAVATARTGRSRTGLGDGEQLSAAHKQIHQRTGNEQPVRVFLQPAVAHFHESELQLHHLKHVLHPRPHLRFRSVLRPCHFIHDLALVATAPLGEIPRSWRALADQRILSDSQINVVLWAGTHAQTQADQAWSSAH